MFGWYFGVTWRGNRFPFTAATFIRLVALVIEATRGTQLRDKLIHTLRLRPNPKVLGSMSLA